MSLKLLKVSFPSVFGWRSTSSVAAARLESGLREDALQKFCALLGLIARIFGVPRTGAVHIFEEDGSTIAFNRGGTLFFNLLYFAAKHHDRENQFGNALSYWYTVFAHEVAHNASSGHGKQHGDAMELLIMAHLPQLAQRLPTGATWAGMPTNAGENFALKLLDSSDSSSQVQWGFLASAVGERPKIVRDIVRQHPREWKDFLCIRDDMGLTFSEEMMARALQQTQVRGQIDLDQAMCQCLEGMSR